MRIIIRADASKDLGAGHVMRVSAVAEELIARGLDVVFIGNITNLPWVQEHIDLLGFSAVLSDPNSFCSDPAADIFVLDSYTIAAENDFIQQYKWHSVVAIVDDATPGYFADLYVHSGAGTNWNPPSTQTVFKFLSGIDFLIIRKSIRELQTNRKKVSALPLRISVVGGGSDPYGFCKAVVEVLHKFKGDFLASIFTNDEFGYGLDPRIQFIPIGPSYEESLADTDLVFTTAGTSSWELLALGIPVGLGLAADNQLSNYEYQTTEELVLPIGYFEAPSSWHLIEENIKTLISNSKVRETLQNNSMQHVDLLGVNRVVQAILNI